jgi:hypothetical protein
MRDSHDQGGQDAHAPERRPYRRPVLSPYGRLAELTRAVGITGAMDKAPSPPKKVKTGI